MPAMRTLQICAFWTLKRGTIIRRWCFLNCDTFAAFFAVNGDVPLVRFDIFGCLHDEVVPFVQPPLLCSPPHSPSKIISCHRYRCLNNKKAAPRGTARLPCRLSSAPHVLSEPSASRSTGTITASSSNICFMKPNKSYSLDFPWYSSS